MVGDCMWNREKSPYWLWCQKVLPLVYDDSLSYYEVLCKLTETINELITKIGENDDTIYSYIDNAIASVESRCKTYTNKKIDEALSSVLVMINAIYAYINGQDMLIRNKYDKELSELWRALRNIPIDGSGLVINPITLKIDSVQNTFDTMYEMMRYFGLTCYEYDNLELTCDEYDSYNITCIQYELYGKLKFMGDWMKKYLFMPDPVSGLYRDVRDIVAWLTSLHRENGITCSEYAEKDKTCEEYDQYNMTAYMYDWNAKIIMV